MRAAVITGPGRIEIRECPLPAPGEGEVLVRLEGCGICGSNLVPWSGPPWMQFPTDPGELGHEGWGHIAALGSKAVGLEIGQRVATIGQRSFATHEVVAAERVVALPCELDGLPFPGEAFACAMNIFRRSGIAPGLRVAIVGIGFLGGVLSRLAATEGAQVIGISRRASALQIAHLMGAEETLEFDGQVRERVAELTGDRLCDVVIECVGTQAALDLASGLVATRGRLVIAGYHQDGPRLVDMQSWNWRGIDVVNAHEREVAVYVEGLRMAIEATRSGRLDPSVLVTHAFPLNRLDAALDAQRDRPPGLIKGWVQCN